MRRLLLDKCRCYGIDFEHNGQVMICSERDSCERYLQRDTGRVFADGLCGVIQGEFDQKIERTT